MSQFNISAGPLERAPKRRRVAQEREPEPEAEEVPDEAEEGAETEDESTGEGEGEGEDESEKEKPSATTPATEAPVAIIDPFARVKKVILIKNYYRLLGHRLTGLQKDVSSLDQYGIEELDKHLNEIEFALDCSSPLSFSHVATDVALKVYEETAINMGIECRGLSKAVQADNEWRELCIEMDLKAANFAGSNIWMRSGWKVVQLTYALHKANENSKNVPVPDVAIVPRELAQRWAHL
jgi:hypothetical protein